MFSTNKLNSSFKDQLVGWLHILSAISGAISVISAVSRLFEVGLVPVLASLVEFYRVLFSPIYFLFNLLPLPFDLPLWAVDLMIVYLSLFAMNIRSDFGRSANHNYNERHSSYALDQTQYVLFAVIEPQNWPRLICLLSLIQLQPLKTYLRTQRTADALRTAYDTASKRLAAERAEMRREGRRYLNCEPEGKYEFERAMEAHEAARFDLFWIASMPIAAIAFFLLNGFIAV